MCILNSKELLDYLTERKELRFKDFAELVNLFVSRNPYVQVGPYHLTLSLLDFNNNCQRHFGGVGLGTISTNAEFIFIDDSGHVRTLVGMFALVKEDRDSQGEIIFNASELR